MIIYAKIANVNDLINENHLLSCIKNNNTQETIEALEYYLKQLRNSYVPFIYNKYGYKPYIYHNNWRFYTNFENVFGFILATKEFITNDKTIMYTSDVIKLLALSHNKMTLRKYYTNSPKIEEQKYGRDNNYFEVDTIDGNKIDYDEYPFIFTDKLVLF